MHRERLNADDKGTAWHVMVRARRKVRKYAEKSAAGEPLNKVESDEGGVKA